MNIPKWLQSTIAAAGLATAVGLTADGVKKDVERTLTFHGTPAEVDAAIRAKFPDKEVQEAAISSMDRRLDYIAQQYKDGRIVSVSGDFHLDPGRQNSIFPTGFDHNQIADVEFLDDDGVKQVVQFDMTEVSQDITDNSRQTKEVQ